MIYLVQHEVAVQRLLQRMKRRSVNVEKLDRSGIDEAVVPLSVGLPLEKNTIDDTNAPPAANKNQALTIHAALHVGSMASSALPAAGVNESVLPVGSVKQLLTAPKTLAKNKMPTDCDAFEKFATPSASLLER